MTIIKINNAGNGCNKDLTPEELQEGVWSDVINMRFANGYVQRFKALRQIFTAPSVNPYYITPYATLDKRYWIHAGTQKVFADDGTTRTEITPATLFTGSVDDRWSSTSLGGVLVMTNGVETPRYWAGDVTKNLDELPAWEADHRCRSIHAFQNYLVALDITRYKYAKQISSITRSGTTATLTTSVAHDLTTGDSITVSGATPADYNGAFTITVTGSKTFTYVMAADPGSSASPVGTYLVNTTLRFPNMVKWSSAAVPGTLPTTWDETDVTADAGEQDLAETPDLIVDALPFGDALVIYKERSAYLMRFIGQPYIFSFKRIPGNNGMLFMGCGASIPTGHVVLTAGDVMLFDGTSFKSIADGVVRRHIFQNINTESFKKAFVCTNPQRNEVLICYPEGMSSVCNKAAVWNWSTGLWGFRDLSSVYYGASGQISVQIPNTWSSDSGSWVFDTTAWNEDEYAPNEDRLLLVSSSAINAFDVGGSDDGLVALTGVAERKGVTFGDAYSIKLVRAVYPRVEAPTGSKLLVEVGASMNADAEPTWSGPVEFEVGRQIKADLFAQGRFLAFRFTGDFPWRMRSFDVDVVSSGAY